MTLLTAGYWHTRYWAENYWNRLYWVAYGVEVPPTPPTAPTSSLPPRRVKPLKHIKKPLDPDLLRILKDYLKLKVKGD